MATTQNQQHHGAARRILFADDHQETRRVMSLLLTHAGFIVDAAENGHQALHLFREAPEEYDVLITDHEMPELDGLGLVEKLREARFHGKIIVVSGGLSFGNAEAYTALQVDEILSKPVRRRALIEAIQDPHSQSDGEGMTPEQRGAPDGALAQLE